MNMNSHKICWDAVFVVRVSRNMPCGLHAAYLRIAYIVYDGNKRNGA